MNLLIRVTILLLLATTSVSARIAENLAECMLRYGKPLARDDLAAGLERRRAGAVGDSVVFRKDGISVVVSFLDGRAERIAFAKDIRNEGSLEFSSREVDALLKANGGGREWKITTGSSSEGEEWRTSDGSRFASNLSHRVVVETERYRRWLKAKSESEKSKQKGDAADRMKDF